MFSVALVAVAAVLLAHLSVVVAAILKDNRVDLQIRLLVSLGLWDIHFASLMARGCTALGLPAPYKLLPQIVSKLLPARLMTISL